MLAKNCTVEFILYVEDQERSALFYRELLKLEKSLHVPGITEFVLSEGCTLGIMPNAGIEKIIGKQMKAPQLGTGIPRCELYLFVDDVNDAFAHALSCGAISVSDVKVRDWGDTVGYVVDPDGHVLAFAQDKKKC